MTSAVCGSVESASRIQCGSCKRRLPLRISSGHENDAVWVCAKCNLPYVSTFDAENLVEQAQWVNLDRRYFDISRSPSIPLEQRREVARVSRRRVATFILEQRRSQRIPQSLILPAIEMNEHLCPVGKPFPIVAANLSREGVGLVHSKRLLHPYIALEFSATAEKTIQVITRVVRQQSLNIHFVEIGGEFVARLGSVAQP